MTAKTYAEMANIHAERLAQKREKYHETSVKNCKHDKRYLQTGYGFAGGGGLGAYHYCTKCQQVVDKVYER